MPETSVASTSSMILMDNEESSHSMPGTSTASTSSLMLRNNDETTHETPFKRSQSISKRSNEFRDSMPGTSKASTSSMILRNNKESSHETPFKSYRSILKRSNEFGDSMPGTSKASTSSIMFRNDEESSHETPFKSYRSISKRSNEFGDGMPGTSKASTTSMLLTVSKVPFQETPFKSYRSNEFGDSMPGTSKASTSTVILKNNEESSHETPFRSYRSISKRSNEFGDSMPGTSKASTSSMILKNKESSHETPFISYRSISKRSNKNVTILNGHIDSNNYQGNSSRSLVTNHLKSEFDEESDDDSCIIITDPVETVELISDDEDDDNDPIITIDDIVELSDDEETVELSQDEVIIDLSSDSEDSDNNMKKEYVNNVPEKLYYCSICQKKNVLNHNCTRHTKSFFTCLVPCCNVLSRSKKDFTFHYQPHIGMSSSAIMCHRCFKAVDQSNNDGNGRHIICDIEDAFRCFSCNIRYENIHIFAYHKLKHHNAFLMDSHCNYICLYCEKSTQNLNEIKSHMKHCLKSQIQNGTAASMKSNKETELLPVKIRKKNVNNNSSVRTSQHVLFTCLKPSCDIIFQSFSNFKQHYRRHFQLGNALVCWQCCKPCSDIPDLRAHQVKNKCRIPGMYKCYKCPSKFDDVESLSIHKLTFHEGKLIAGKKNRKTIMCAFCQTDINIFNFKSHLATCQKKDSKQNTCTTKSKDNFTCETCERVFASSISLSNHSRVHKRPQISNLKKEST